MGVQRGPRLSWPLQKTCWAWHLGLRLWSPRPFQPNHRQYNQPSSHHHEYIYARAIHERTRPIERRYHHGRKDQLQHKSKHAEDLRDVTFRRNLVFQQSSFWAAWKLDSNRCQEREWVVPVCCTEDQTVYLNWCGLFRVIWTKQRCKSLWDDSADRFQGGTSSLHAGSRSWFWFVRAKIQYWKFGRHLQLVQKKLFRRFTRQQDFHQFDDYKLPGLACSGNLDPSFIQGSAGSVRNLRISTFAELRTSYDEIRKQIK